MVPGIPARVLVLSDLHLKAAGGSVRGVDTRANLAAAVAHARAAGGIDRVVLLGDVAEDGRPGAYRLVRETLGDWADQALVLAGNHDVPEALRAELPAGPDGFIADAGGWRLVGVHTHWRGHVAGRLGASRLAFVEQALAASPAPAVLFLHHPPVTVSTGWLDFTRLADAAELGRVLAQSGRARAVVHGHVHMPSEGTLAGARVLGMPSTAFQFVPGSLVPRRGSPIPGYRVLELGERLATHVVYVGGRP
jgi:Icc protein